SPLLEACSDCLEIYSRTRLRHHRDNLLRAATSLLKSPATATTGIRGVSVRVAGFDAK
ncbi:unnamed protein product, partial [Musa hybrid cultivar]